MTSVGGEGRATRPQRSDARQNQQRILAASRALLGRDPAASMDDIAREAGVGRMTLYGHYRTRAVLLTAVLEQALSDGEERLSGVDLDGPAPDALARLLTSSWDLIEESAALLTAADGLVPAEQLKAMHAAPAQRITTLLSRGQEDGDVRGDLPVSWLASAIHYILHGAAVEVRQGALAAEDASGVVASTIAAMLRPAGS